MPGPVIIGVACLFLFVCLSLCVLPGGVLKRNGHTEATVDLARMAGFAPAGVLCEIVTEVRMFCLSTDKQGSVRRDGRVCRVVVSGWCRPCLRGRPPFLF